MLHYTHEYLLNPQHKVSVDLIGVGGTGSQVLSGLARMNEALMKLNHPGLHVTAWDPDIVSDANMGRQLFSTADLGQNKAAVLITRVNRFFGTDWQAKGMNYTGKETSNILITCIDTAAGRIKIAEQLSKYNYSNRRQPYDDAYYWLDLGNLQNTGQVVLGTVQKIPQPPKHPKLPKSEAIKSVLPNVVKKFPQLKKIVEAKQGPSCSLAEALEKQDLFINSTMAQFGCGLIWKLFREGKIRYHGCYVNLETLSVNPIRI